MIRSEFNDMIESVWQSITQISKAKGKDYAGDSDVAANFKRQANNLGLTPEQIWAVYANKHWDAVNAYCKNGKLESEPISERLKDIIVYSLLLMAMVKEKEDGLKANSTDPGRE